MFWYGGGVQHVIKIDSIESKLAVELNVIETNQLFSTERGVNKIEIELGIKWDPVG